MAAGRAQASAAKARGPSANGLNTRCRCARCPPRLRAAADTGREFARVLAAVWSGHVVLIGGDPWFGKTRSLSQVAAQFADAVGQRSMSCRSRFTNQAEYHALGLDPRHVGLRNRLDSILGISKSAPRLVVVDSIQTVYLDDLPRRPAVSAVARMRARLLRLAKSPAIPCSCRPVTRRRDRRAAGDGAYRDVCVPERALHRTGCARVTNRFGSTDEVVVFRWRRRCARFEPVAAIPGRAHAVAPLSRGVTMEGTGRSWRAGADANTARSAAGPPTARQTLLMLMQS